MRTTVTLDPDLATHIKRLRRERGVSMARVVNDLVRAGLRASEHKPARKPYRLKLRWRAKSLVGRLDNVGELLAIADGELAR